jgi:CRP/FNR family transcriptional activator FtrB
MHHGLHHSSPEPQLLAGMAPREFERLIDGAASIHVPARQTLFTEGLRPMFLHILLEGTVELFIRRGRRESCITLVQRNTPFVLAAVVTDAPYLMSARTVTDARILCIAAGKFRSALRRDPGLTIATATAVSEAYRSIVRQLRSQRLRSAQMRLAHYLVGLHHGAGSNGTIRLEISKRRLASLIGLKPESLSRVFASLGQYGVQVSGSQITVQDFRVLEDLAQFDYDIDAE